MPDIDLMVLIDRDWYVGDHFVLVSQTDSCDILIDDNDSFIGVVSLATGTLIISAGVDIDNSVSAMAIFELCRTFKIIKVLEG